MRAIPLLLLLAAPAAAHAPYAVKVAEFQSPDGRPLLVERLFGDGLMGPDPVSLQVRTTDGALLAYTPAAQFLAVHCPSLDSCRAFPHDILLPAAAPWRLEAASMDYSTRPAAGIVLQTRGSSVYGFGRPNAREPVAFVREPSLLWTAASLLFTLKHHVPLLAFLALFFLVPSGLARFFGPRIAASEGGARFALKAAAGVLYAGWGVLLLPVGLMTVTGMAPWLYCLLAAGGAHLAFERLLARK